MDKGVFVFVFLLTHVTHYSLSLSLSRIFIKELLLEMSQYMGVPKLLERFRDYTLAVCYAGIFPRDNPKDTRSVIPHNITPHNITPHNITPHNITPHNIERIITSHTPLSDMPSFRCVLVPLHISVMHVLMNT